MASLKSFASTRILSGLVSVGLALAMVRWMPVAEFAKYIMLVSAAGVASIVASLGFDRVMYRYVPEAHLNGQLVFLRKLARFAISSRLCISAIVSILVLWLTSMMSHTSHPHWHYLVACAFAAALGATDVYSILANSLLRFETQAKIGLTALLLRATSLGILATTLPELNLGLVMAVLLIAEVLQAVALYAMAVLPEMEKMAAVPVARVSEPPSRVGIQKLATTNYLSYIVGLPWQGGMLRLLVGSFAAVTDTALFGFLQTLADRLRQYLPIQLLQNALEPLLVRKHTQDQDTHALSSALEMLRRINFAILLLGVVASLLVGNELIAVVSKGKFTEAGNLCALIIFSLAVNSIGGVLWISSNVLNQMSNLTRIFSLVTLVLLPFLGLAALYGGTYGIALATLFPSALTWAVLRIKGNPAAVGLWRLDRDALALLAAGCALAAGYGLKREWTTPLGMALAMTLAITLYLLLIWVLQVIKNADVNALRAMLRPTSKV